MSESNASRAATAAPDAPSPSPRARLMNLVLLAVFDVGLAILAFEVVRSMTHDLVLAYLAASIGPIVGGLIQWIRSHSFSGVSLLILLFTVLSAAAAVIGGTDPRLLLVKYSLITGVFGLVFLLSLLPVVRRPLGFYFGQRFATDGTEASVAWWDGLWQYPSFRASQRRITAVWGTVFVLEAIARVVAAYTLPFSVAFALSAVLPLVALGIAMTLTIVLAKQARAEGQAHSSADNAVEAPVGTEQVA